MLETIQSAALLAPETANMIKGYAQMRGFDRDTAELAGAAKEDFTSKEGLLRKVAIGGALAATVVTLSVEWGGANETILAFVGGKSLASAEGVVAPLEVGVKTGAVAFLLQSAYGLGAMGTMRAIPNFGDALHDIKNDRQLPDTKEDPEKPKGLFGRVFTRATKAFMAGAALLLANDHANQPDRTIVEDLSSVAGSAAGVGAYTVAVGGAVGLLSFQPEAAHFAGENIPKLAVAALGAILIGKFVKGHKEAVNSAIDAPIEAVVITDITEQPTEGE